MIMVSMSISVPALFRSSSCVDDVLCNIVLCDVFKGFCGVRLRRPHVWAGLRLLTVGVFRAEEGYRGVPEERREANSISKQSHQHLRAPVNAVDVEELGPVGCVAAGAGMVMPVSTLAAVLAGMLDCVADCLSRCGTRRAESWR